MKNTIYRLFVTVAVISATACSDPFVDAPKPPQPENPKIQTTEFHTEVTMWYRNDDKGYMGLVSLTPYTDLSKATFYAVNSGNKYLIQSFPDNRIQAYREMYNGYLWANIQNNVLMMYFNGGPNATPPFPLEIIIEY